MNSASDMCWVLNRILPKVASLESCRKWRHPTSKPCPPHEGWHWGWVKGWFSCSVVSDSCDPMDCSPPGSSVQGIAQARILEQLVIGKNTGMGCHFLLPGIFPTRGLNPGLLHCRWILYWLSHQGLQGRACCFPGDVSLAGTVLVHIPPVCSIQSSWLL